MLELANKVQIRLKSKKSGKYLRCNKAGGVDATAGKSPDGVFMVHRIDCNQLKLQSCENPEQWLQCAADGTINDKGKGGADCIFFIKHHERETISLCPKFNLDWHVGCDASGKIMNASKIGHTIESAFDIELLNAQILMPGRV